jgi:predicted ArsR family transcriptional regulator
MYSVAVSTEIEDPAWALAEPVRRSLYRYVAAQKGDVSRDQAAEALSIPRHVAKFHLDRLEAEGLLEVEYRRPDGRGGPGAGRPTKWYRAQQAEVSVSVPKRHYDLLGEVMAAAIDAADASGVDLSRIMQAAATTRGEQVGRASDGLRDALVTTGYEPEETDAAIILRNCPFHRLAQEHTELVCGINLCFVEGVLDAVDDEGYVAHLRPRPDTCCVTLDRQG